MNQPSGAFATQQFQEAYPDGIQHHYWNLCRNLILKNELTKIGDFGKILEVGAGRGIVTDFFRKSGFEIWGCELSKVELIDKSIENFFFNNQNAFQLEAKFRAEIRTLLLLDVLEHIENPAAFLDECKTRFPALKYVLVTVPARQELMSNYDEEYGHFRRYDLKSATLFFKIGNGNWKLKNFHYFFHLLYPVVRTMLALGIFRSTSIQAPATKMQIRFHNIIARLFRLENRLLPRSLPGTSLFLLLEKG